MAETVPPSQWGGLVYSPAPGYANGSAGNFGKMKFDKIHYLRAYNQCRGRGGGHDDCVKSAPTDAYITPQNPLPQHFTKEMVDAIECMSDTGDVARCNHYMEVAYRKTHEESSKPDSRNPKDLHFCE